MRNSMNNALRKINSILNKSKKREESIFLFNLKSDATIFVTFQRCMFLFLVWINICTNILQIQAEILSLYKKKKTKKKRRGRMLHDNNKYQLNQGNGIKWRKGKKWKTNKKCKQKNAVRQQKAYRFPIQYYVSSLE